MTKCQRLLANTTRDDPNLHTFVRSIGSLDIDARKTVLTLCRIGIVPSLRSRAYGRLKEQLGRVILDANGNRSRDYTLLLLVTPIRKYIESPYTAGLIESAVKTVPMQKEEVEELVQTAVRKEIMASIEPKHGPIFNWAAILSKKNSERLRYLLSPSYPDNPDLRNEIFRLLSLSKSVLSRITIYPHYSEKTLGETATRNLPKQFKEEPPNSWNTTKALERVFHRYGLIVAGPTELRVAFKYTDIRPRPYFAQGPSDYYDSRFIQPIFNVILDSIPAVNRKVRYEVSGVRMTEEEVMFIYDYASFTSRLQEIYSFTRQLASFFAGTMVTIIDTRVGPVQVDLGVLLNAYNDTCNQSSYFELANHLDEDEFGERVCLVHLAGKLGVPGNISSSTLLHGIHLMVLCISLHVRCVGDDALGFGLIHKEERASFIEKLSNIGDVSEVKTEWWTGEDGRQDGLDDDRWNYVKRPIYRLEDRVMLESDKAIWPSFCTIFPNLGDALHTGNRNAGIDRKRVASMMITFCRQFTDPESLQEFERAAIDSYLDQVLQYAGLKMYDKRSRCYMFEEGLFYPRSLEEVNLEIMKERISLERAVYRIPDMHSAYGYPDCQVEFVGRSSRSLKLAKDLGYAEVDLMTRTVIGCDEYDDCRRFLERDFDARYLVLLSSSIPSYLLDLIRSEARFPAHQSEDDNSEAEYYGEMYS